jgi:hypothetical protein
MRFRYADGSPLPMTGDFLDTLTRMLGVGAELLGTERLIDAGWDDAATPPLKLLIERALPLSGLPETRTAIRFAAGRRGGDGRLVVSESTYFLLTAHAAVDLGPDTVFHGPFRVREVATDCELMLPGDGGWFGRARAGHKKLDKYFVTAVEATDELRAFSLARKPTSAPIRVVLRAPGLRRPSLLLPDGGRDVLDPADAATASEIWNRLVRGMWNRAQRARWRLISGEFEGHSLTSVTDASRIGRRLLDAVAPLAAEIYHRGQRHDALVLLAEDGTTRQLPVEDLARALASLPTRARAAFAPMGLESWASGGHRLRSVA